MFCRRCMTCDTMCRRFPKDFLHQGCRRDKPRAVRCGARAACCPPNAYRSIHTTLASLSAKCHKYFFGCNPPVRFPFPDSRFPIRDSRFPPALSSYLCRQAGRENEMHNTFKSHPAILFCVDAIPFFLLFSLPSPTPTPTPTPTQCS